MSLNPNNFYGIVIGSNTLPEEAQQLWQPDTIGCDRHMFDYKQDFTDNVYVQNSQKMLQSIMEFTQKIESTIVYHDPKKGVFENCKFKHGPHYHILANVRRDGDADCTNSAGLHNISGWRLVNKAAKETGYFCKAQRIAHPTSFCKYLAKPPRMLIGHGSEAMQNFYVDANLQEILAPSTPPPTARVILPRITTSPKRSMEEDSNDSSSSKKSKLSKAGEDLQELMNLLYKFKCSDLNRVYFLARVNNMPDAEITALNYLAKPMSTHLVRTAVRALVVQDTRTYGDIFNAETTKENIRFSSLQPMGINETHELFKLWADEKKNIVKSPAYFMACMYAVLFQKVSKRNTFLLIGAPSSGKTYWTDPVLWLKQYVGLSSNDSHFCFAELTHSKVGLLNELRFSRETLDAYKELGEGKECMVPVKNCGMGTVYSQPIFVTVNLEPWAVCPDGKPAMEERSFTFKFSSSSRVLAENKVKVINKTPNPRWYKRVFSGIAEFLHEKNLNLTDMVGDMDKYKDDWFDLNVFLQFYPDPDSDTDTASENEDEQDLKSVSRPESPYSSLCADCGLFYNGNDCDCQQTPALLQQSKVTHDLTVPLITENIFTAEETAAIDSILKELDPELVKEVEKMEVCEMCGYEGSCNGGKNCQLYAQYKEELDAIAEMIEEDEKREREMCICSGHSTVECPSCLIQSEEPECISETVY